MTYPNYEVGMNLPDGIMPPLSGYTNEELMAEASMAALDYLLAQDVSTVLANETEFSVSAFINQAFQENLVEYKIASYCKLCDDNREAWESGIDEIADEFSLMAGKAAIAAIEDSPILDEGEDLIRKFLDIVYFTIHENILALKNRQIS